MPPPPPHFRQGSFALKTRCRFVLKTRDQQHYFNAPYQLAVIPDGTSSTVTDTPVYDNLDIILGSFRAPFPAP